MERPRPINKIRGFIGYRRLNVDIVPKSPRGGREFSITTNKSYRQTDTDPESNIRISKNHYPTFRSVDNRTRLSVAVRTGLAAAVSGLGIYSGVNVADDINNLKFGELGDGFTGEGIIISALYTKNALREARTALAKRREVRNTKRAARRILNPKISVGEQSQLIKDYPAAERVSEILREDKSEED